MLISFIERVKTSIALATEPLIRGLELVENVVLKLLHLDNEAVLLLDEIVAKVEEVGPLFLHDQVQQLILETCLGDGEIYQCRLRLNLGRVVWVAQLGVKVKSEVHL